MAEIFSEDVTCEKKFLNLYKVKGMTAALKSSKPVNFSPKLRDVIICFFGGGISSNGMHDYPVLYAKSKGKLQSGFSHREIAFTEEFSQA